MIAETLTLSAYAGIGGRESQSRRRIQDNDNNIVDINGTLSCKMPEGENAGQPCALSLYDESKKKTFTIGDNKITDELRTQFNSGHKRARIKGNLKLNDRLHVVPYKIVEIK